MARPTKHYSRELSLMLLMEPGNRFIFPSKHPRGLAAKMYAFLKHSGEHDDEFKLTIKEDSVIVVRFKEPLLVTTNVYRMFGL